MSSRHINLIVFIPVGARLQGYLSRETGEEVGDISFKNTTFNYYLTIFILEITHSRWYHLVSAIILSDSEVLQIHHNPENKHPVFY